MHVVSPTQSRFSPQATANFYQDTVNRVSNSAAHAQLPAITATIDRLVEEGRGNSALLRRLKSQELGLYIRYRLGKKRPVPLAFIKALNWRAAADWRHIALAAASSVFHFRGKA